MSDNPTKQVRTLRHAKNLLSSQTVEDLTANYFQQTQTAHEVQTPPSPTPRLPHGYEPNSREVKDSKKHQNLWEAFLSPYYRDQEKLRYLKQIFSQFAEDKNCELKAVFNQWLQNPLPHFSKRLDVWNDLANMILSQISLLDILPSLLDIFKQESYVFHDPDLDLALWNPVLSMSYEPLLGVACFHQFLWEKGQNHQALWQARTLLISSPEWSKLHSWGLTCIHESFAFTEAQRLDLLLLLRTASMPREIAIKDVEDYVQKFGLPQHLDQRQEFLALARYYKSKDLEYKILQQQLMMDSLNHEDMTRLMMLSFERGAYDLGWRVATVLQARGQLEPKLQELWKISGEDRKSPIFYPPKKFDLKVCFLGFNETEQSFLLSFFFIAPWLGCFAEKKSDTFAFKKLKDVDKDTVEARIINLLKSCNWLTIPKGFGLYGAEWDIVGEKKSEELLFLNRLPVDEWGMLFKILASLFGLGMFSWSLSGMNKLSEKFLANTSESPDAKTLKHKLNPKAATGDELSRFISDLSFEERMAWYKFRSQAKKITDQEAQWLFLRMTCRLSTLILQNHYQALLAIQHAPQKLRLDLEQWILSPAYTELRKKIGCSHFLEYQP